MALKRVFKCTIPNSQYIFKNGKSAAFLGGEYLTDTPSEIEQLEDEIKQHHPHIYIDAEKKQVDTDDLDPLAHVKKAAVEAYKKELADVEAAMHKGDMGKTDGSGGAGTGIATSASVSGGAKASDSSTGARLANLVAGSGAKK